MKLHDLNKILFFCIFLFILSFQNVNAQAFLFKVIASSGNAAFLKPSSNKWINIKTGDKILTGYKLKLESGDYLGLINNNGRSLEIKQAGTYNADELNKNIPKGSTNLQKFADFVMNESAANKKKTENMKNLGAVVRARAGLIESGFPDNTDLLNLRLEPVWYSAGPGTIYVFKILNPLGRSIFIKETNDTSLTIDLKQFGLLTEQNYSWCVINSRDPEINSDTLTFRILSDNNIKIITDSLKVIRENLDVNSGVDQFLLVKYFESKDLNCEALTGYESLIKTYPLVESYSDNYLLFLTKQGLSKNAETFLSTIKK
jgi:hypothetical protein